MTRQAYTPRVPTAISHAPAGRLRTGIFSAIVVAAFFSVAGIRPACAQSASVTVTGIRAGFQRIVKTGYWLPVAVDIETRNTDFRGRLQIIVPDSDDLDTSIVREVYVGRDTSETIHHFVKPGGIDARITAQLLDADGRVVAKRQIESGDLSQRPLQASQILVVSLGSPSGLRDENVAVEKVLPTDLPQVFASLVSETELPTQWFAYGAVEHFVLATGDAVMLDRVDPGRASALRTWVRQGGHLVVSVANNWQVVGKSSLIGPLLPAKLTGVVSLRSPESIEVFAGSRSRLVAGPEGIPIATIEDIRGRVLVRHENRPLIVRGAYGLGTVTLMAFDTESGAFRQWAGATDFWHKLLGLARPAPEKEDDTQPMRRMASPSVTDLATVLTWRLEHFPSVTVVPFGWVALLIFLYILLIGPVDYFFLKRVVGRLELTWITFPTWVIIISVAAYYTAYWLKGDSLRINRIEVVDVDQASETLRGTGFLSIFSPRIDTYTLATTPSLAAAGGWADLGLGREQSDRTTSWLGVPEDAFRSLYSQGNVGLLGRKGYLYHGPEANAVENAPIKVWSVGSFTSRWLAKAHNVLDADLRTDDNLITGTITNRLDVPMTDVIVAFGSIAYELGRLEPNIALDLATRHQRLLSGLLDDQTLANLSQNRFVAGPQRQEPEIGSLMRALLFAARTPERFRQLPNHYHRDLDLSSRLDLGKVVILARVDAPGGQLWINGLPETHNQPPAVNAETRQDTFLRVILEPKRTKP